MVNRFSFLNINEDPDLGEKEILAQLKAPWSGVWSLDFSHRCGRCMIITIIVTGIYQAVIV